MIGDGIADASALKMCYGALNKGTQALWLEVLIAAQRLGVAGFLEQQLQQSQADRYNWASRPVSHPAAQGLSLGAGNARDLQDAGLGRHHAENVQGAADIYRFVAGTALGKETPENRDKARDGRDVVRLLAQ